MLRDKPGGGNFILRGKPHRLQARARPFRGTGSEKKPGGRRRAPGRRWPRLGQVMEPRVRRALRGGDLGEDSETLMEVESSGLGGYGGLSRLGRLGVAGGGEGTEASSGSKSLQDVWVEWWLILCVGQLG